MNSGLYKHTQIHATIQVNTHKHHNTKEKKEKAKKEKFTFMNFAVIIILKLNVYSKNALTLN